MHRLLRFISLCLIIAIGASLLPAPRPLAAAQAAPALAASGADSQAKGVLLYAPAIDADGDPATNPTANAPLAVSRLGSADMADPVLYTVIAIALQVQPADARANPAGTPVTVRVWNTDTGVDIIQHVEADAWGAAALDLTLDDLHLAGTYAYQASAPGFGATPVRTFTIDTSRSRSDSLLGGATLATEIASDGRLSATITADRVLDTGPMAAQLLVVRLTPTSAEPSVPERELLPPLVAERLDDHHARAEIYLDDGDYLVSAIGISGDVEAQSAPQLIHLSGVARPPLASAEEVNAASQAEQPLVYGRTANGDVVLQRRAAASMPAPAAAAGPQVVRERVRTSAFEWRTDTYTITTQTVTDDGKKVASLDGFAYDPIARRYTIAIQSLLDQPINDTLTVEVLGPNGVVIYSETSPITLDPAAPTRYDLSVPTDRGEPLGLRVIVHDPLDLSWLIQKSSDALTSVFNAFASVAPIGDGFTFTAGFKGSFKVLGIDVISASVLCAVGNGCQIKKSGLIEKPGDWVDIVTTGVRDYLRSKFGVGSVEEAVKKVFLKGLDLGSLSLSATAGGRYTKNLYDPVKCPDPDSEAQIQEYVKTLGRELKELGGLITTRFKKLSEKFQGKAFADLPVPGVWFLSVSLSPILAFKLDGGTSGSYGVYGELQAEIGVKGSLMLQSFGVLALLAKILDFKEVVVGLYTSIELLVQGVQLFKLIAAATKLKPGTKDCDPPPPNGSPDDRLDAFANEFLPGPTGNSGSIAYAQSQIALAQRQGLARAETYWTLQLRQAEYAAWSADTTRVISGAAELDTLFSTAESQISGVLSGTILPEPGETVTSTVQLLYTQLADDIANTDYDRERRVRLESVEFAQRQYSLLRGQELELQRELRLMSQASGVGVLDSGLVTWAMAAIGTVGVDPVPVQIVAGVTSSHLPNSRVYSPYDAPPVLFIPSGGLNRYGENQQARQWLATYVASGGTLIALAQADSADWTMLPGGEVTGLGYNQDILCKTASVQIVNPSPWIAGIEHDLPDIQVDGSFTSWPANASVVLMRTTGNKMPAMIEYPFGAGRVVATSAYPDFYINGMQSLDDIIFARSLFGVAYLEGTGQSVSDSVAPGQPAQISLTITNTSTITASQVTVWGDYYSNRIAESWRWAAHQPYQLRASQVIALDPPLPAGASRAVSFSFTAGSRPGLFRTAYFLGSSNWWSSGSIPGPFYQVRSPELDIALPGFQLIPDRAAYRYGDTATLTVSVRNTGNLTRTFTLVPEAGLDAGATALAVGPRSTAIQTFTTDVRGQREVRLTVEENGRAISRLVSLLRLLPPSFGLDYAPDHLIAGLATTVALTGTGVNVAPGTPLAWEVRRDGQLLSSFATPLAGGAAATRATTTTVIPASDPGALVTIRGALPTGGVAQTATLNVRPAAGLLAPRIVRPLEIGALTPDALVLALTDERVAGSADVQVLVQSGGDTLASGPVSRHGFGAGTQAITLPVALPSSLDLYRGYTLVVSATVGVDGGDRHPASAELPLPLRAPAATLAASERTVRQPLDIRLAAPEIQLPAAGPYAIRLHGLTTPFEAEISLPGGTVGSGGLDLATAVPDLLAGGLYEAEITSPRLQHWRATVRWVTPDHRLEDSLPATGVAGVPLPWSIANRGGVDTVITGTLSLSDLQGRTLEAIEVSAGLPIGASVTRALSVSDQLRSGRYLVRWQGVDHRAQPSSIAHIVELSGLQIELESQTDRLAYLTTDTVSTTTTINTSAALSGAMLRLQVLKPVGLAIGWAAQAANAGRTNAVESTVAGPFSAGWSLDQGYTGINPVTIGDVVYTVREQAPAATLAVAESGNYSVQASSSLDGEPLWSAWYAAPPKELAANGRMVYVLTSGEGADAGVVAFDARTGEQAWFASSPSSSDLLVSDQAVAVYSAAQGGYLLFDPNGGEPTTLAADQSPALLVEGTLLRHDGSQLLAYDVISGTQRWSATLQASATLLSANTDHVVASVSYGGTTTLLVYDAQSGAFERSIRVGVAAQNPPPQTTPLSIVGAPLSLAVANTTQAAVHYEGFQQFYGGNASGIYLAVNGRLYGPPAVPAGQRANPYSLVSNTGPTGSGTPADPWVITTVFGVPTTPLRMTVDTSYIQGDQFYRTDVTLQNTDPITGVVYRVNHAADLYPSNPRGTASDNAYGYYDQNTGAVGAFQNDPWYQLFEPITPADAYQEGSYSLIWRQIGSTSGVGPGFDNTINPAYVDAGAGLQWNGVVPANGSVTISDRMRFASNPDAFSSVLRGDSFYYLVNKPTASGIQSTIVAVDLSNGSSNTFLQQASDLRGMIATGDTLYVLRRDTSTLLALDPAGEVIEERSLNDLAYAQNLDGLAVSDQGLLVIANGGAEVNLLRSLAANEGAGTARALKVLQEEWLPVDGAGALTLDRVLAGLTANPEARGQLYLGATLFSRDPAAASRSRRHILAQDEYPFSIDSAQSDLALAADRSIYRLNQPATAVDDAAANVVLHGSVRNTSSLPSPVTVTVVRSDGAPVGAATVAALAPGASAAFELADPNPPAGTVTYSATSSLGGAAGASIEVVEPRLYVSAAATPASLLLGESAVVRATLTNGSRVPAFVEVDLGAGPQALELAPGSRTPAEAVVTPASAGDTLLPVTVSGDLERTINAAVSVRAEQAAINLSLIDTAQPEVGVAGEPAVIRAAIIKDDAAQFPAVIELAIAGPAALTRTLDVLLEANTGLAVFDLPLGALPAGHYTAVASIRHGRTGQVLSQTTLEFDQAAADWQLAIDTAISSNPDGSAAIEVSASASSAVAGREWLGTLVLSGPLDRVEPISIFPNSGVSASYQFDPASLAGLRELTIQLIGADGVVAAERRVSLEGAPQAAPQARLVGLSASPANAGGLTTLTATLENSVAAGEVVLDITAFDQTYQLIAHIGPAGGTATLEVAVPAEILSGAYPVSARLGAAERHADVQVSGAELSLAQQLDQTSYAPWSTVSWTLSLSQTVGATATYDVLARYGGETITRTVELSAGDVENFTVDFPAGPVSDRATILVTNHPATAEQSRYTLLIDSAYVLVREDDRAWLASDRGSYQAGDVVQLTINLSQPTRSALVLAPAGIPSADGLLLWNSFALPAAGDTVQGAWTFPFTLPATLPTGRYAFTYLFDGEERSLPIDVFGIDLRTAPLTIERSGAGGSDLLIATELTSDQPVAQAAITAWALGPDGSYQSLGAASTASLPAGTTAISLPAHLTATTGGAYQIVLAVDDGASGIRLGGTAAFIDVGTATISGLATDRGIYALNEAGQGTITLFGSAPARVLVTTSDGTPLLDETIALDGYAQRSFSIPTGVSHDDVLLATLTDTLGLVSTAQAAYRVAPRLDTTAPALTIETPANGSILAATSAAPLSQIVVSGRVTDTGGLDQVIVNGVLAEVSGNEWSATLALPLGASAIQAVAEDAAGNLSVSELSTVVVEPGYAMSLAVSNPRPALGEVVVFEAVVSSTHALSATALFAFDAGALEPISGESSAGAVATGPTFVIWTGSIDPAAPVVFRWSARALTVGTSSVWAVVQGAAVSARRSNTVELTIIPEAPTSTPTALPTSTPTALPTSTPTALPTSTPTALPTSTSTPVATATATPTPPTVTPADAVVVRHGPTLNGRARVDGSLRQLAGDGATLNGEAAVTGDYLAPGSPTILQNGRPTVGAIVVGTGSAQPSNYQITLNGTVRVGRIVKRTDPIALPAVAAPPAPTGTRDVVISQPGQPIGDPQTLRNLTLNSNVGAVAVPPGTYGAFVANSGTTLVLGVAGASQPSVYNLQGLTVNGGATVRIVGPVILNLARGFTADGSLGASDHLDWLSANVAGGNILFNGNSRFYGLLRAPSSSVALNNGSALRGGLLADRLVLNDEALIARP